MKKFFIIFYCISFFTFKTQSQDYVISHVSNHNQNHFGWSISSDNNYVAVSDPRDSITYYANGCVNIYKKFGYEWEYMQTLQNKEINPYNYFGHRTFMSGNHLAISSIGDRTMGFMSGAVHVFCLNNGTWTFQQTIRQPEVEDKAQFGEAIYMSGQYLFVGAPGYGNGTVFIYSFSENSFTLLQEIVNPDSSGKQFGKSLAFANGWLYIGAPSANSPMQKGGVYLYSRNGITWELNHTQSVLVPDDIDYGALFGYSVSAEEDKLLVGAPHANIFNENGEEIFFGGKVYYYQYSYSTGLYTKINEFINPDPDSHDLFGSDVMISDSLLFMTSPKDDINENDEGNIYIFRTVGGQWVHTALNNKEANENQYFANNFFVDGWNLFIGSAGNKTEKNKGVLYTYDVRKLLDPDKKVDVKEIISIFPNPADEKFRITISENVEYTVRIYSTDGKEFYLNNLKGNNEVNVSNLYDGYYIISVNTKKQTYTEKLAILHKKK